LITVILLYQILKSICQIFSSLAPLKSLGKDFMSRRLAREVALQALYQLDMVPVSETSLDDRISEVIDEAVANGGQLSGKDKKYIFSVVKGTRKIRRP